MPRRCVGGPLHGHEADERLGDRWPAAIVAEYGEPSALIGDYRLWNGQYVWLEDSVRTWWKPTG